jgi:hypothetical protein
MTRTVAIIGGSVGGLFAANMLRRRGWDVHVFERVTGGLASRGAGIARHDEMQAVMEAAGIDYETLDGVEMTGEPCSITTEHCSNTFPMRSGFPLGVPYTGRFMRHFPPSGTTRARNFNRFVPASGAT